MVITRIFENTPRKKKTEDNILKDVLRVIRISDPRDLPKDISTKRLQDIYTYVRYNNVDFSAFQEIMLKMKLIPGFMGDIGYI